MGKTPRNRDNTTARAAATPHFAQPNFRLVGEAKGPEPGLVDLLRYSHLERVGRHRWRVLATGDERVRGRGHLVALNRTMLVCDCRQGFVGRACAHTLVVRQFGTIPAPPLLGEQMRLVPDALPLVRVVVDGRRSAVGFNAKPLARTTGDLLDQVRADGGPR
jgi:hypothetical protein